MRSAGDDLISVPAAGPYAAQALAQRLRASGNFLDVVAGIDSVVVRIDLALLERSDAQELLKEHLSDSVEPTAARSDFIELPIVYGGDDGPDLAALCDRLKMTREHFIDLHCGDYIVDMLGFTPGFAYIGGLDAALDVPRLDEPRVRVAAGSVGIAGGRTGIYALPGPGGWPLIGRTDLPLFDGSREQPFVLAPGMRVRFVAVDR